MHPNIFNANLMHELEHLVSLQENDLIEKVWNTRSGVSGKRTDQDEFLRALNEVLIEASSKNRLAKRGEIEDEDAVALLTDDLFDLKAFVRTLSPDIYSYPATFKRIADLLGDKNLQIPWKEVRKFLYKGHLLSLCLLLKKSLPAENFREFALLGPISSSNADITHDNPLRDHEETGRSWNDNQRISDAEIEEDQDAYYLYMIHEQLENEEER